MVRLISSVCELAHERARRGKVRHVSRKRPEMKKKAFVIVSALLLVGVAVAVVGVWSYLSTAPNGSKPVTEVKDTPQEVVIPRTEARTVSPDKETKAENLTESVKRVESKLASAKQRDSTKPLVPARAGNTRAAAQVPIRPAPTPARQSQSPEALPPEMEEVAPEAGAESQSVDRAPGITADKLNALALGMTYEQVALTLGDAGRILGDGLGVPFQPVGWATVEWGSREAGLFSGVFNASELLVSVDVFNVPGAEALAAAPANAIRIWLNNALAQDRLAVRVPVVLAKPSGPGSYEYSAALVSEAGIEAGEIAGFYRLGDGTTTVASGDNQAYRRLLEGVYEVVYEDGSNASDAFTLVEY